MLGLNQSAVTAALGIPAHRRSEKEQVRARMRAAVRRLLTRYGYPPDKQPAAIELVMDQAELLARAA